MTTSVQTRAVTDDEAELRLDRWFRRHFPAVTQGAIQKLCRTGQIRVDGKRAETSTRLEPGQAIRVPPLPDAHLRRSRPKPTSSTRRSRGSWRRWCCTATTTCWC